MKNKTGIGNPYYLIEKYFAGNASPEEVQDLFNWKNISFENERLFEQCYSIYECTGQFDVCMDIESTSDWGIFERISDVEGKEEYKTPIWMYFLIFIISFLLSAAVYFLYTHHEREAIQDGSEILTEKLNEGIGFEFSERVE